MVSPVSVWAATRADASTGRARERRSAAWTVSSFFVADGEPAELVGVLDPEAEVTEVLLAVEKFTVNLLGWQHRGLADACAGLAPAPGGVFTANARPGTTWIDTEWGPVLSDAPGWLGARLLPGQGSPEGQGSYAGWGLLVRATVENVAIGPDPDDGLLTHLRGRYRQIASTR